MRALLLAPAMLLTIGATEPIDTPEPLNLELPSYVEPAKAWQDSGELARELAAAECRDRIYEARAEAGLPRLDRETASADEPVMIYAVDRREDGCAVMVVKDNPEDIRPIPKPPEEHGFIPATTSETGD